MKIEMKLLFLALMVLFVGCSNDAVSSHDVIPIAGDISSSAVQPSSGSEKFVEQNSSSSAENFSSAEESSSSSSESLSSSSESAESSSSSSLSYCMLVYNNEYLCRLCDESSSSMMVVFGEMTDERDGQTYKTITIDGKATWMAENLNYAYLQPTAEQDSSSWCYNNEPDSCTKYGRLYLWSAVMDSAGLFSSDTKDCGYYAEEYDWYRCPKDSNVRGVCPEHWHGPSSDEFSEPLKLANESVTCGFYSYGGGYNRLTYFGNTRNNPNILLAYEWAEDGVEYSEEDLQRFEKQGRGFNVRRAGRYDSEEREFEYNHIAAFRWFSNEDGNITAATIDLPELLPEGYYDPRTVGWKKMAFPVRCVKDEEVEE